MKKRMILILLLFVAVVSIFSALGSGKGKNEIVGIWVAASEHRVYPDVITLKSDGSGSVDGLWSYFNGSADNIALTWYADGNTLTIITEEYGERAYSYKISDNKMWLDDYLYFKQ